MSSTNEFDIVANDIFNVTTKQVKKSPKDESYSSVILGVNQDFTDDVTEEEQEELIKKYSIPEVSDKDNYYTFKINGSYYVKSSNTDFNLYENVKIRIPNGSWDNMYIEVQRDTVGNTDTSAKWYVEVEAPTEDIKDGDYWVQLHGSVSVDDEGNRTVSTSKSIKSVFQWNEEDSKWLEKYSCIGVYLDEDHTAERFNDYSDDALKNIRDGYTYQINPYSHAEGYKTIAQGGRSHAEGSETSTYGGSSHAEGMLTNAIGQASHAEGRETSAISSMSHAEGYKCEAGGECSHAEGNQTNAAGANSHVEGELTRTMGRNAHAEGYKTFAKGAMNDTNTGDGALATSAHAEGVLTEAIGQGSHAEGYLSKALGYYTHAGGVGTIAGKEWEEGDTIADTAYGQTVVGRWNSEALGALFIVGCGEGDDNRANAFMVSNGQVSVNGNLVISDSLSCNNLYCNDTGTFLYSIADNDTIKIQDGKLSVNESALDLGSTYTAGEGISIADDEISVKYDEETMKILDNGKLASKGITVVIQEKDSSYLLHEYTEVEYIDGNRIGYAGPDNQIIIQGIISHKRGAKAPNGVSISEISNKSAADFPDIPVYGSMLFKEMGVLKTSPNYYCAGFHVAPSEADVGSSKYRLAFKTATEDGGESTTTWGYNQTVYDNDCGVTFVWDKIYPPGTYEATTISKYFPYGYAVGHLFVKRKSTTSGNYTSAIMSDYDCALPFLSEAEYNAAVGLTYEPQTLIKIEETVTEV